MAFASYLAVLTISSSAILTEAKFTVDRFFKLRLGIASDAELLGLKWPELVKRLSEAQNEQRYCIVKEELSREEISSIVFREDHFIKGLCEAVEEVSGGKSQRNDQGSSLDPSVPQTTTPSILPSLARRYVYTTAVQWNFRLLLSSAILDDRSRMRDSFFEDEVIVSRAHKDPSSNPSPAVLTGSVLAKTARLLALAHLLLLAPLLLFALFYFFIRDADDLRSARLSPFKRQWTALTKLCGIHETPQDCKSRLRAGEAAAESLLAAAGEGAVPELDYARKFVKFSCGSITGVLLVLAVLHEDSVFGLHIFGKNLIWWLGVMGGIVHVAGKSEDETRLNNSLGSPIQATLATLCSTLHGLPSLKSFRPSPLSDPCGRADFSEKLAFTAAQISEIFRPRLLVLFDELMGVALAPLILLWVSTNASEISTVLASGVKRTENLGDFFIGRGNREMNVLSSLDSGSQVLSGKTRLAILTGKAEVEVYKELNFGNSEIGKELQSAANAGGVSVWEVIERIGEDSLLNHPWLKRIHSNAS